ncbi:MAG: hypothetical protein GVY16_07860 [Planctomycetes bacterium]|jgi:hypothetical protein|nr:hypothetical protein [Phycisphaerae bacterium]NBB95642.1 hypothetical protein [Planctomycetota bacterium]
MNRYRLAAASRIVPCLLLILILATGGCQTGNQTAPRGPVAPAIDDEDTSVAEKDGLFLVLDLPKAQFQPGETFTATIMATNASDQPVDIEATSSALYTIHLWRPDTGQWQRFKTYPEMGAMVITPWTLQPGETRTFTPTLTVESEWPSYELIRVQAELSAVPDLNPHVDVEVVKSE